MPRVWNHSDVEQFLRWPVHSIQSMAPGSARQNGLRQQIVSAREWLLLESTMSGRKRPGRATAMNDSMRRFLEECRQQPFFAAQPGELEKVQAVLDALYSIATENDAMQAYCDQICTTLTDANQPFRTRLRLLLDLRLEIDRQRDRFN